MANMRMEKAPMPMQDAVERSRNFNEVALGYSAEIARDEAARCLNCRHKPCVSGCPVQIDIPAFLKEVAEGNEKGAYAILSRSSALPAVCGRVCPQENQCEAKCVRGIKGEAVAIGRVERYVADWHMANGEPLEKPVSNGIKMAIIGAGPSGLTCAGDLARLGYDVTVFEALHVAGGVLVVKQYLKTLFPDATGQELYEKAYALIMSTAGHAGVVLVVIQRGVLTAEDDGYVLAFHRIGHFHQGVTGVVNHNTGRAQLQNACVAGGIIPDSVGQQYHGGTVLLLENIQNCFEVILSIISPTNLRHRLFPLPDLQSC